MSASRRSLPVSRLPRRWQNFQANLAQLFGAFEEGDTLILARHDANVFVQFAHSGSLLFAEAASNQYIDPPIFLLDERHFAAAVALGWQPPSAVPRAVEELSDPNLDDTQYNGSPNFYRQWTRWNANHVAALAVQTLRQVYGVRRLDLLCYSSFKESGGMQVRWPTLGIAHYDSIKYRNLTIPDADDGW